MSPLRLIAPAMLLIASIPAVASAQEPISIPFAKTTYCVQLQYEMWRNGASYWSTEYETADYEEALLMHDLFEIAIENGAICEVMGCGFDWIIRDVRIYTNREYYQLAPALSGRDFNLRRFP